MIRPAGFRSNKATTGSNAFQHDMDDIDPYKLSVEAAREFDNFTTTLEINKIPIEVYDESGERDTPDAVFPNNWITFHEDGKIITYPMMAPNRRKERREDIVNDLKDRYGFTEVIDLSHYEEKGRFLEGTGSLVFDHEHRFVYANTSPRTDEGLVREVADILEYKPLIFKAKDDDGLDIYHTNVHMCIGEGFAVLCSECIHPVEDSERVVQNLEETGHEVVGITLEQLKQFAGNMLELKNESGYKKLLLSQTAFNSLDPYQIQRFSQYASLLPISIPTIERYSGGSVRCMMADIYLPEG